MREKEGGLWNTKNEIPRGCPEKISQSWNVAWAKDRDASGILLAVSSLSFFFFSSSLILLSPEYLGFICWLCLFSSSLWQQSRQHVRAFLFLFVSKTREHETLFEWHDADDWRFYEFLFEHWQQSFGGLISKISSEISFLFLWIHHRILSCPSWPFCPSTNLCDLILMAILHIPMYFFFWNKVVVGSKRRRVSPIPVGGIPVDVTLLWTAWSRSGMPEGEFFVS